MHGDRDAFGALASSSLPRLVGTAGLILGNHDVAEDAVQEALVRAWRDLPSLRDADRFDAWLYRVLLRACHDQHRRRARDYDLTTQLHEPTDAVPDHTSSFAERDAIQASLRRLTVDQRTILVLRYYLELTHPEIAHVALIPLGTVKSRINRALSALQAELAAETRGVATERPA